MIHKQTSWFFLVNQKHAETNDSNERLHLKHSLKRQVSSLDESETLPCNIYSISKDTERLRDSYPYEKYVYSSVQLVNFFKTKNRKV